MKKNYRKQPKSLDDMISAFLKEANDRKKKAKTPNRKRRKNKGDKDIG